MNVIFKTGVIAALVFLSIISFRFRQVHAGGKNLLIKKYFERVKNRIKIFIEDENKNTLLRSRLLIASNILLLTILAGTKLLLSDAFYYALPCILFLFVVLNMDWILKTRRNSDFVGEAAIGYLIFISYLLFIILFLFLITIYFNNSETNYLFM